MKFENPTMTISMFEVENVATTASAPEITNDVNASVSEFISNNGGAGTTAGIKLVF